MDSPSKKIKDLVHQLESLQNENVRIHEALVTTTETNCLLKDENDAVKDVNKQLRTMVTVRRTEAPTTKNNTTTI